MAATRPRTAGQASAEVLLGAGTSPPPRRRGRAGGAPRRNDRCGRAVGSTGPVEPHPTRAAAGDADPAARLGRRVTTAMRVDAVMHAAHPEEPHWYLAVIGSDPTVR